MTDEQKAAYVIAQAAAAFAETCGMLAENQKRLNDNEALAYPESAFQEVILRYGIGHNDVIGLFHHS